MKLPPLSFAVFDTETTGFVPKVHHVIEYASIRVENEQITDTYEQLFLVEEDIPPHVQVLTRIRPETIAGKPRFQEKQSEIEERLKSLDILVGQNLGFDLGMLKGEGIDLTDHPWIDTSMLASLVFPEFESYSLQYMSNALNLNHEPAHRALGDVRATLELLGKIWERLLELDAKHTAFAKSVMAKVGGGYQLLFDALPDEGGKGATWMHISAGLEDNTNIEPISMPVPPEGAIELHEEGVDPYALQRIINAAASDESVKKIIAVKNLDLTLHRLHLPTGAAVIHPAYQLLDARAASALSGQQTLNPDEGLLELKLAWYAPRTRNDLPIHGGEKDVWYGKLACTDASSAYTDQFKAPANVYLLDHRQLLSFVQDPEHTAHGLMKDGAHIIIDDASMLEDTATKAFGFYLNVDSLRAASSGDDALTRLTDLLSIWLERIRNGEDQYFIQAADATMPEVTSLKSIVEQELARSDLPPKTKELLEAAKGLLTLEPGKGDLLWAESKRDGGLFLQSAPLHIDTVLKEKLFDRYQTTLLVPNDCGHGLPEIVSSGIETVRTSADIQPQMKVTFNSEHTMDELLTSVLPGKTIILAPSKRVIEQLYIQHTEALERKGVTLICQGLNGGQGRMQSEFLSAKEPAVLVLTPFMYEGFDFPIGTADRLILCSIPFDHPNHPVIGRRGKRYQNAFSSYSMPRALFRLFRLMRTFAKHRKENGEVIVIDKRIEEKSYGETIREYMEGVSGKGAEEKGGSGEEEGDRGVQMGLGI